MNHFNRHRIKVIETHYNNQNNAVIDKINSEYHGNRSGIHLINFQFLITSVHAQSREHTHTHTHAHE